MTISHTAGTRALYPTGGIGVGTNARIANRDRDPRETIITRNAQFLTESGPLWNIGRQNKAHSAEYWQAKQCALYGILAGKTITITYSLS